MTVIIPAHNESAVIGRLLNALQGVSDDRPAHVIVVCNGCTDDTAAVARAHPLEPEVLELPVGSKHLALLEGDRVATAYPRFYVDADVVITAGDIQLLAGELEKGALAVAPGRRLRLESSSRVVRSYYRLWQCLPAVRAGLFGRGVIGVSAEGGQRLEDRPEVMGDDLYVHSRFADEERTVVEAAVSQVFAPRTVTDLFQRRVRAAQGNRELRSSAVSDSDDHTTATASLTDVFSIVRSDPRRGLDAMVFVGVTLFARSAGRSRRAKTWLRDESSRQ